MIQKSTTIHIKIADALFPIQVKNQYEELAYRQAEKEIKERIRFYESEYAKISRQDALAMCLISYVYKEKITKIDYQSAEQEIEQMNRLIDEVI